MKRKRIQVKINKTTLERSLLNLIRSFKRIEVRAVALLIVCVMVASVLPEIEINANAAETGISQTKYTDINDFQNSHIAEIQKEIFIPAAADKSRAEELWNNGEPFAYGYDGGGNLKDVEKNMIDWTVRDNNKYFNWTKNLTDEEGKTLIPWDGENHPAFSSYKELFGIESAADFKNRVYKYYPTVNVSEDGEITKSGTFEEIKYTVINVQNPSQFRWAMQCLIDGAEDGENILINITKDLDLNGQNNKDWESINLDNPKLNSVYIEGNGHTIYNFRTSQNGLFDSCNTNLIIKNLGIKTSMITTGEPKGANSGFIYGTSGNNTSKYLYNVHVSDSYVQNYTNNYVGSLTGYTINHTGLFVKNCSTNNIIVIGQKHISGFCSYTQGKADIFDKKTVSYHEEFPSSPEEIIFDSGNLLKNGFHYPAMYEGCYSVGCEVFSLGNDSGAFISCGGCLIVRNCYTNNNIYADSNTGGFFGRDISVPSIKDDKGLNIISSYFENCYSSGLVEGRNSLGGFVGYVECLRSIEESYQMRKDNLDADYVPAPDGNSLKTYAGSNVFKNCYSSAAVGMDYAGRYCGGFTGLDDSYVFDTTLNIEGESEPVTFNGTAYINCYATGEVGNILTVSSPEAAIEQEDEKDYLADNVYGEGHDNKNGSEVIILDYYPTGGFIGALCPDRWWVATAAAYKDNRYIQFTPDEEAETKFKNEYSDLNIDDYIVYDKEFGYFKNCFYDMQTTAMREMAIGMQGGDYSPKVGDKNYDAYKDVDFVFKTCNGVPDKPFSLPGVTGVYTVESEAKEVDGLTNFPNGPQGYAMDIKGADSDVWNYLEGYYPQLDSFMTTDIAYSDVQYDELDANEKKALEKSPFYIPESDVSTVTEDEKTYTVGAVSKMVDGYDSLSEVIRAFRYSQASTAAVMLNHWDNRMDIATGMISTDSDWIAVPENAMTFDEESGYYTLDYKDVPAGQYEFKIQANNTSTFNYGYNKFKGDNCTLVLTEESDVTIKFKYDEKNIGSSDYYILADIYVDRDGDGKKETLLEGDRWLGGINAGTAETWTVVGEMPESNWDQTDERYDMKRDSENPYIYRLTVHFDLKDITDDDGQVTGKETNSTFEFKIAKDHAWAVSYGYNGELGGMNNNMSFTIDQPCDVTFEFNNQTHFVTVDGDHIIEKHLDERTVYDFEGISVIGQQKLTGYNWLGSGDDAIASATAGKMTETPEGSGIYIKTYENVPMNDRYAYKVIKNAVDEGENNFFVIKPHISDPSATCTVTITYDESADESTVSAKVPGDDTEYAQNGFYSATDEVTFFSVLGDIGLTGYHWEGDNYDIGPDMTPEQYKAAAIANGKMTREGVTSALWSVTFKDVEAGTYGFKVAVDGDLDYSYGEPGTNSNYMIELTQKANVTITFNPEKERISVTTDPEEALKTTVYVVTGNENLTGLIWDKKNGIMSYDAEEGLYYYDFLNGDYPGYTGSEPDSPRAITANGSNYAFKVIEYDKDNDKKNYSFSLGDEGDNKAYYLRVTYDAVKGVTDLLVFEDPAMTRLAAGAEHKVVEKTFSVLGDKGLTGHNWLGLNDNGFPGTPQEQEQATIDGNMTETFKDSGVFYKKYDGVALGNSGDPVSYAFKIAANGNWDSGIDYGNENGGDYVLTLVGDGVVDTCSVTIWFNKNETDLAKKIWVEVEPEENVEILNKVDTSSFVWYVVGDYQLTSGDSFIAPANVYDTVRDITKTIEFTTGAQTDQRGISWQIDEDRNKLYEYYDSLGGEDGFQLEYEVDAKGTVTGTFIDSILDLNYEIREDKDYQSDLKYDDDYTYYMCNNFMPGKQFMLISAIGYGYDSGYNQWQKDLDRYNQYVSDKETFQEMATMYYAILSGTELDTNDPQVLIDYLQKLDEEHYNELAEHYGDILKYSYSMTTTVDPPDKVPDINNQEIVGTRRIRLIPQAYLEAGYDAEVSVIKDQGSTGVSNNRVTYSNRNTGSTNVNFKDKNGNTIENVGYTYYNFAFTAAYAVSDKIGIGIYDNYHYQDEDNKYNEKAHGIVTYDKNLLREEDTQTDREADTYFAMVSTFTQSPKYDDGIRLNAEGERVDLNGNSMELPTNLSAGVLLQQALIGDSYDYNSEDYNSINPPDPSEKRFGQTTIKVMKVNDDGTKETLYMNPNGTSRSKEKILYQKWSGQRIFESSDEGTYEVHFYWLMSDGRYFEDYKLVTIDAIEPGVTKKVNKPYDDAGSDSQLAYTVKYTNEKSDNPVTFAIFDVLPFNKDGRIVYNKELAEEHPEENDYISTEIADDSKQTDTLAYPGDNKIYNNQRGHWSDYTDSSADPGSNYVYLKNDSDWSELYCYMWTGDDKNAEWPGTAMTDLGDGVWRYKLPDGKEYENIIFNNGNKTRDISFTLNSIEAWQSGEAQIKAIYYTTDVNVRNYMYKDGYNWNDQWTDEHQIKNGLYTDAARNLGLKAVNVQVGGASDPNGGQIDFTPYSDSEGNPVKNKNGIVGTDANGVEWTKIERKGTVDASGTYKLYDDTGEEGVKGVTAVVVTGIQLAVSKSVEAILNVEFDSKGNDYLVNNAFYHVLYEDEIGTQQSLASYSNDVKTTYVSRDVSGIVWLDNDRNGIRDEGQPPIENVRVTLLKQETVDGKTEFVKTGLITYTNDQGYYSFDGLLGGTYKTVFSAPDETASQTLGLEEGIVIIHDGDNGEGREIEFEKLGLSQVMDVYYGSRNIANLYKIDYDPNKEDSANEEPETGDGEAGKASYSDVETQSAAEGNVVYVKNTAGWDKVYCHTWGNGDSANTTWPGKEMEPIGNDIWKYTVPEGVTGLIFNGGENKPQTKDLTYPGTNYIYDNSYENDEGWSEYTADEQDNRIVYVKNTAGWDKVYCHTWGSGDDTNTTWPGKEMEPIGDNIWKYTLSEGVTGLIFNGGENKPQTNNLTYPGPNHIYDNSYENDEGWSEYTESKEEYTPQPEYPNWNSYFIDVALPDSKAIYDQAPVTSYNAELNNYIYSQNEQNAALAESNSLRLEKYKEGDEPSPLAGAVFRLEYQVTLEDGSTAWKRVVFNSGLADFVESETPGVGEYYTDSDGVIKFRNLPDGKYRITEVKSADGFNKLTSSIEIDLPYQLPNDAADDFFISQTDEKNGGENYVTSDGRFREITMKITNTTLFDLPLTGTSDFNIWLIIIGIILVLVGTGTFLYVLKRKKKAALKSAE